jgi:hypothetical protein
MKLLRGTTVAVDNTDREPTDALERIALKDTGAGYKDCLKRPPPSKGSRVRPRGHPPLRQGEERLQ